MISKHKHIFLILFLSISIFSGCSSDSDPNNDTLTGTVATGAAGVGTLYVTDANGTEINVALLAANNGQYTANVTGMTPPFILGFDSDDNGTGTIDLYSFAEAINTTANVSQLSTLTLFLANNETDLSSLYDDWDTTQLTMANIASAQEIVNANLATQIDAISGLNAANYDFMTTSFTADGTGIDALLDDISIDLSDPNNFTITLAGVNGYTFDVNVDTSTITVGDTVIGSNNYDPTCSSGWCVTVSGTLTKSGVVTTIPETRLFTNLADDKVPTAANGAALQQVFENGYAAGGAISDYSSEITTNTATKVVAEVNATLTTTISDFGVSLDVDSTFHLIYTYTKAAP